MFITFEGVDGTGKTSIAKLLYDYLSSYHNIYFYNEPLNNEFGEMAKFGIDGLEKIDLVYLWWLSRKFEINRKLFKEADIIIADRYYDTTYVYAVHNQTQNMINHNFDSQYFKEPDLTFILQCEPQEIINRIKHKDSDQYSSTDIKKLEFINEKFKEIKTICPNRNIQYIDTTNHTISNLFHDCLLKIENLFDKKGDVNEQR